MLQPGQEAGDEIASTGENPVVSIECEHLVDGRRIEFEANID
jgi:hypothetical protein